MTQCSLGTKGFIWLTYLNKAGTWGKNLEAEADAKVIAKCSLLDYSPWLAQCAFL